jgi:ATP-dependent RNA helicase DDX3X
LKFVTILPINQKSLSSQPNKCCTFNYSNNKYLKQWTTIQVRIETLTSFLNLDNTFKNYNKGYNEGNNYRGNSNNYGGNGSNYQADSRSNNKYYSNYNNNRQNSGKYNDWNQSSDNQQSGNYRNNYNNSENEGFKERTETSQLPSQVKNQSSQYDSTPTQWAYRYNRNGYIRNHILSEDEEMFLEHQEHLKKNKTFDFTLLEAMKLSIYFQNKEIPPEEDLKKFSQLTFHKKLKGNLDKMGYDLMTPIQRCVVPFISQGSDVMGCSQTGSGKTIAFLGPIISQMFEEGPPKKEVGISAPVCLILVPTRELADQIFKEARKLLHTSGVSVVKVYGGVPHDSQIKEIKYGADILVATPGRLIDFLDRNMITLSMVRYFIIDEADRILDMGFEDQLRDIVFNKDMPDKSIRQNLMFSATFPPEVREISKKFMNEYYFVTNNLEFSANENIDQTLHYVEENNKILKLHEILQKIKGSVISKN